MLPNILPYLDSFRSRKLCLAAVWRPDFSGQYNLSLKGEVSSSNQEVFGQVAVIKYYNKGIKMANASNASVSRTVAMFAPMAGISLSILL